MKEGAIFGLFLFGVIFASLFVSAQVNIYCNDSDAGKITDEKIYNLIDNDGVYGLNVGETYKDIDTGEEITISEDSSYWNNKQVEEQGNGVTKYILRKFEGYNGETNFFEKGEVY